MILQQNDISRPILLKYLAEGICQVSFTKRDGTNRVLLATLQPDLIPSKFSKSVGSVFNPTPNEDLIPVWDVTEGAWKSFKITKVLSFRTSDEIKEQDQTGQDVDTKQKENLQDRRKIAEEKSKVRKQQIREQIKSSKETASERANKTKEILNQLRNEAIERRNNG